MFSTDSPADELKGPLVPTAGASLETIALARELVRGQHRPLAIDLIAGATTLDPLLGREGFECIDQRTVMTAPASIGENSPDARPATREDLDTIVALQALAFDMSMPAAQSLFGPGWKNTRSKHILVEADSEVVAMATAHPTDEAIGIFGVCTHPDHRGRGLATTAVRAAVAHVSPPGDSRPVWLHCNQQLEPVYESMHFAGVGASNIYLESHV